MTEEKRMLKEQETAQVRCEISFRNGHAQWRINALGNVGKDDPVDVLSSSISELSNVINQIK